MSYEHSAPLQHNLPAPLTSLVGREADIAEAYALLRQADVRRLTMTGPGGVGKTRLALRVAGELLNDFEHGVFFVPLASIGDPQLVVSRIGQTLDVRESGGQSLLELLKAYLREKHLLLVLDNYEHVLAAALQVGDLLLTCPTLKILVTSRALLRLDGEREYTVSPLELPELAADRRSQTETLGPPSPVLRHVVSSPAVELFLQRAQAVRRDFEHSTNPQQQEPNFHCSFVAMPASAASTESARPVPARRKPSQYNLAPPPGEAAPHAPGR